MATILLTWELGGGIGHLMSLRPIGQELVRRGHRVIAALRDLSRVGPIYRQTGIAFIPAPIVVPQGGHRFEPPQGFAHILANIGFADPTCLDTAFRAWNTLFDCVQPDLIVADHSPTALLALRGRPIPRVNVGIGFFCPPKGFPLPFWSQTKGSDMRTQMARDERPITEVANRILEAHERPPLERLAQIFSEIEETFLATYAEFDHYGPRKDARYWGHWPFGGGIAPVWPEGKGPKVYAYLKAFPALEDTLRTLRELANPTIVLAGGIDPALRAKYTCTTMRFEDQPLDLQKVGHESDLAILNANHGTAAAILLAGKPCLLIPIFLEQMLFAQKVEQSGAGLVVSQRDGQGLAAALRQILANTKYRDAAHTFAAHYANLVPGEQIPELVDHLERHLTQSAPAAGKS